MDARHDRVEPDMELGTDATKLAHVERCVNAITVASLPECQKNAIARDRQNLLFREISHRGLAPRGSA